MIQTISIQGFRSFDPANATAIDLSRDKRVAYFYGLNGAGKSAIGQVIQRIGNGEEVPNCSLSTPNGVRYEYLVYNEHFVEKNFRNRSDMPGIFTIGNPESAALEEAERLEDELQTWQSQLEALAEQETMRVQEARDAKESVLDGVWKSYAKLKEGPFKPLLMYGNSKQRFFDALDLRSKATYEGEAEELDDLSKRLQELGDGHTATKPRIALQVPNLFRVEDDELWQEPIVGSNDSALAPLIRHIGNMDWVSQGRPHLAQSEEHCPFCQQNLPHNFTHDLTALFDASFEERTGRILELSKSYATAIDAFNQALEKLIDEEPYADESSDLKLAWAEAYRLLGENSNRMDGKVTSPQSVCTLQSSRASLQEVEKALNAVSLRINEFNRRINHRDKEKAKIERGLWQRLCQDNAGMLSLYRTTATSIQSALDAISGAKSDLKREIHNAEIRLIDLRGQSSGTHEAVAAINGRLQGLGVHAFKIAKRDDDDLYHLVRPGNIVDDYASLSEGEKTLITFLYFVELITRSPSSNYNKPLNRKVVVIDDPISSLSHNYVYDIAATISRDIIGLRDDQGEKLKQIIVLTHSLFFLNELIKVSKKQEAVELKRVVKKNFTTTVPMDINDLQNDYEAWWQVVRDGYQDRVISSTLANAMRCILERFFYFTRSKQAFHSAMDKLSAQDRSFLALSRYLDHHSHGDANTLTDFGEYDVQYCLRKFQSIFEELGFTEHHRVMAGLPEQQ
ncbi:AAA family ATPase [Xanthomonas cucurbitae]|uniref:AAA family ATPase n=1 Tax=Xanthomonas cucurbitae TaxID=56453 RepID=A0ABY7YG60_9XANT|nr:AAA family ATPase [Xanthomonas cucurbitae]WDM69001.1 AAA family ATPase [Xanthomonas cucurbitae]WDM72873.1 AAA family ATPase [Xanthomonas cucurbitae]